MVEGGFTRAKNVANTMMKNFGDFSMAALGFWILGFGIMFGNGNAFFGTTGFFVTAGTGDLYGSLSWTSVPTLTAWFFQLMFCATAATIVAGAMAERTRFLSYLSSVFHFAFFYPVVGHWIWGGGWLAELGMLDLPAPRSCTPPVRVRSGGRDRLGAQARQVQRSGGAPRAPGSQPDARYARVFILWFGWFGFNTGSIMAARVVEISVIAANTSLAAAAAAIGATVAAWFLFGKPDVTMALNGALAGLVAITADVPGWSPGPRSSSSASFRVSSWSSPFDVRTVADRRSGGRDIRPWVSGAVGTVLVGLFHTESGLLYGGGVDLLMAQVVGVVGVFAFCMLGGLVMFNAIRVVVGLRVPPEAGKDRSGRGRARQRCLSGVRCSGRRRSPKRVTRQSGADAVADDDDAVENLTHLCRVPTSLPT